MKIRYYSYTRPLTITIVTDKSINIIGGGIAGVSLAITLQQLGISHNLYEKNQDLNYDDVGLGISANIFPILNNWNVFSETESIGSYVKDFHFINKDLKYLKSFTLKNPALSVRRKEFYKILQKKLDYTNVFLGQNKSFEDFEQSDILVSADGINSRARNGLHPSIQLRDSGQLLWRGMSRMELPKVYQNAYHDLVGENLRFAIIHTGEDYYSWYLIKDLRESFSDVITKKDLINNFLLDYPEITQEVVTNSNEIFFSKLFDISPYKRRKKSWHRANHIMIGDSIHPTTPNMANGACLSIEDGFLLGNLLSKYELTQEAFDLFQKDREPKVNKVVSQSWLFGKSMHWNNQIMTFLTEKMIQLTPQFLFEAIYSNVLRESKLLPTNDMAHTSK